MDDLGWVVRESFQIGRFVVGVRTNSKEFGAWLKSAFSEFRTDEEIGPLYSVFVGEHYKKKPGKEFHTLYRETLVLARELDLTLVANMLRAEFESLLFTDWDEGIYVEGAVASHNGTSALLPVVGASRLTDIWRKVDRAGVSMPIPGRIAIDPDSGDPVPIPGRMTISDKALDKLTRIAPESGRKRRKPPAGGPAPLSAICFATPKPPFATEGYDLVRPISRAAAVKNLADNQAVNIEAMGVRTLEGFARLTEGIPCYDLVHKNADELLEGLVSVLGSPGAAK